MTPTQHSALVLPILSTVALDRFEKAICGLKDTTLTVVTLTKQTEAEISAYIANGKGQTYGVTIANGGKSFCNCGDRMHRADLAHCKHAAALALHAIRTPQPQLEVDTPTEGASAPAVAVPVDVPREAPIVLAPIRHLQWRDSLVCCGVVAPPHALMYPWPSSILSADDTCKKCIAVHASGFNSYHMTHKAA